MSKAQMQRACTYPIVAAGMGIAIACAFFAVRSALGDTFAEPIFSAALSFTLTAVFAAAGGVLGAKIAGLEQEAATDPLTGIYNRRHVMKRLEEEIAAAKRHRAPLSLLLIDVDRLKTINDELGHDTGDLVLESVGASLRENRRACDIAARIGGDEFVLILPRTAAPQAEAAAERLRSQIRSSCAARARSVTASIGVVELDLSESTDASVLLASADAAMYVAKRAGRDRVVASGKAAAPPITNGLLSAERAARDIGSDPAARCGSRSVAPTHAR